MAEDTLHFNHIRDIKIKIAGKEAMLTLENLGKVTWNQRNCLRLISQQYNPQGLLTPLFLRLRIAMRMVVAIQGGWDTPLPPNMQEVWTKFAKELLEFPDTSFPRSVRPKRFTGNPEFFFDGHMPSASTSDGRLWRVTGRAFCCVLEPASVLSLA